MKQYVVVPRKNEDDIEKYEEGSTNVVEFRALDYKGNIVHNIAELQISFGANAVEGFGNELLRSYISGKKYMEYISKSQMRIIYLGEWEYVFHLKVQMLYLRN